MLYEVAIPWLDFGVKYAVLMFSMYYLFMRCVSEKPSRRKMAASAFFACAMGFSLIWLRAVIGIALMAFMITYFTLTNCLLYRHEMNGGEGEGVQITLGNIWVLSLLCFAFCEALFMLVGVVFSTVLSVFYYTLMPPDCNSVWHFLNDVPIHIAVYFVMIAMVWVITYLSASVKRLRSGLMHLVERRVAGTAVMFAMVMLVTVTAFGNVNSSKEYMVLRGTLFIPTIAFCGIMVIWIKLEIKADYVSQLRKRNLTLIEGSLAEKDRKLRELAEDNEKLADIVRRDTELLGQLTDGSRNGAEAAAALIEKLYAGRCDAVSSIESHGRPICSTGDSTVDGVLLFMANKAEARGVAFGVDVRTDAGELIGREISRREFNTLLADLTENAIISAGAVKDRRVEVVLLRNEGVVTMEVLDSGERFDTEVLKNMGRRHVTTHTGEGGSGRGLMQLFGILRRTGASLAIEEFSGGVESHSYSKSVSVIFDHHGKLRIITERADELKKSLRPGSFEIVKKSG